MSRKIPEDRPLSKEDRGYLEERRQVALIRQIDIDFPSGGDEEDEDVVDVDADISEFAESLTVAKLESRILALHEEDPDSVELPEKGAHKADLVSIYSIALQDKRNAGKQVDLTDGND